MKVALPNGRLEVERELVAAACAGGAAALLGLARTPFRPSWLSGPHRLALEALEALALRGEVAAGPVPAATLAAEVERFAGVELAGEVREAVEVALEGHGGEVTPGAVEGLAGALADGLADAGEDVQGDGLPQRLLPAGRLLDTRFPPVAFAVEPYFPRGEVTELVGAHGLFKSTLALGACLSVASGRAWGGATSTPGRTVFVTMEDAEQTLSRRVKAWLDGLPPGQERGDAEADVRERFAYLGRDQARALALTSSDRHSTAVRASVVEHLSHLVAGASLVVLETASRLHDGPEQNEALAVFAQAVEQIATGTGAAVVVVRHVSKAAAREQIVDSYAGRGGGSLSDAARSVLVVTLDRKPEKDEEDGGEEPTPVRVTHAKSTLTRRGPRLVWLPVVNEHGVYLRSLSEVDATRQAARRLLAHLEGLGDEGLTRTELHKSPPAGLSRQVAKLAAKHLVETGQATEKVEDRGRNKGVTVYRAAARRTP